MARNRGKKALYEVMSKARAKQSYAKSLEQMHSRKSEQVTPAVAPPKPAPEAPKAAAQWRKKPRIAQFNAGRFEFSVPYQVAIALGLVLVLLLLGSYRLGQRSIVPGQLAADESGGQVGKADQESDSGLAKANMQESASPAENVPPQEQVMPNEDATRIVEEQVEPVKPKGKNAIVLAHSGRIVDFQPVVEHYEQHGIALKIVPLENGRYQLRTVEQYVRNPATPGTDAFEAKRRIIEVGELYRGMAPAGLDTFGKHPFSDAYGKKVED